MYVILNSGFKTNTAQEAKPTCSKVVFSVHSTGGQTYLFKGGVFRTQQNLVRLWQKAVLILREHVHVGHGIQNLTCNMGREKIN